jgi:hypothetical protein
MPGLMPVVMSGILSGGLIPGIPSLMASVPCFPGMMNAQGMPSIGTNPFAQLSNPLQPLTSDYSLFMAQQQQQFNHQQQFHNQQQELQQQLQFQMESFNQQLDHSMSQSNLKDDSTQNFVFGRIGEMRMLSSIRCQFHNPISGAHCVVLLYRL